MVGTWDGTTLTLTEPATAPVPAAAGGGYPEVDFTAPCPEPAGGWDPVDPAKATQADFEAATILAQGLAGHGGLWIDQNDGGATPSEADNDPSRVILVVTTTGDMSETEAALREVWGGPLCVAPTERTEAELAEIQSAVMAEVPDVLGSGVSVVDARVEVGVLVATAQLQRQLDEQFGPGVVLLSGALMPVD